MIGLSLSEPGHAFGWSVASQEIATALGLLTEVKDLSAETRLGWDMPILHGVQGANLMPIRSALQSSVRDVGFCFIEEPMLAAKYAVNAARHFSALVTGSTWCTEALKEAFGKALQIPITTAIQGVAQRFFDVERETRLMNPDRDRFIVFSGGKAEFRKSQDVVIRAMKVFMGQHKDVWLNYNWHNPWNVQIPGYAEVLFAARELDHSRVIGPRFAAVDHAKIAGVYERADVGFFPNRCEAGNNMPMCEFMACGKPVIASCATGHADVISPRWTLSLTQGKDLPIKSPQGDLTAIWVEPNLDECLDKLEWAYRHREDLPALGEEYRESVSLLTWELCAKKLLAVLEGK